MRVRERELIVKRSQMNSNKQCKEWLRRQRIRDTARRAAQNVEQRHLSLQQRCDRLVAESAEQREARLQDMSMRQLERLAKESAEVRDEAK